MDIKLTDEEAKNVYVSLIRVSKMPDVDSNTMKYLLILADKFVPRKGEDGTAAPASTDPAKGTPQPGKAHA